MIEFPNSGLMLENEHDVARVRELLPRQGAMLRLYKDYETSSGHDKIKSVNPWHNCTPIGFAFTWDNHPYAYWCDVRMIGDDAVRALAIETNDRCFAGAVWVNHNVKYDVHVEYNTWKLETPPRLCCTLDQAKIIHSDLTFKGGYDLGQLAKRWLHEDISKFEHAFKPYLMIQKNRYSQDYGRIPSPVLGEYACQDVYTNRRIDRYIEANLPDQCRFVSSISNRVVRALVDVERCGLCIDPMELELQHLSGLQELVKLQEELSQLVGYTFDPNDSKHLYDVLINQHGLPVVKYTEKTDKGGGGNPSFDKYAMKEYLSHPYAPVEIVKRISRFKKRDTQLNIFIKPYKAQHVNGRIHSGYNPTVATGRMSCKAPNMQQLDADAKKLIKPSPGHSFISIDYSQIEFRTIVHYCKDPHCIAAYNENPDTDFHEWVADLINIKRGPAKTCNFLMGYGGGKKALVKQLSANMELVGELKAEVGRLVVAGKVDKLREQATFHMLCERRAEAVYDKYHASLPTLKPASWGAAEALKARGFVFNLLGRHRHLDLDGAHKAFNSLNQASAADMFKERMCAAIDWIAEHKYPLYLVATVHDELLFEAPTDWVQAEQHEHGALADLVDLLEHPVVPHGPLRVPLRCCWGISAENWFIAAKPVKDGGTGGLTYPFIAGGKRIRRN